MDCMEVMHLDAVAVLGEIISSLMYLPFFFAYQVFIMSTYSTHFLWLIVVVLSSGYPAIHQPIDAETMITRS